MLRKRSHGKLWLTKGVEPVIKFKIKIIRILSNLIKKLNEM